MSHINVVVLSGRLGTDPEGREFGENKKVSFRLASTRKFNSGGELKEETCWVDVACWGKLGEVVLDNVVKGQEVVVHGRLSIEPYEKDGKKLTFTRIVADDVQFGSKPQDKGAPAPVSKDAVTAALQSYIKLVGNGISSEVAMNAAMNEALKSGG